MNRICEFFLWLVLVGFLFTAYYMGIFRLEIINSSTNPLSRSSNNNNDNNNLFATIAPDTAPTPAPDALIRCSVCGIAKEVGNPNAIVEENGNDSCRQLQIDGEQGLLTSDQCRTLPSKIDSICDCQMVTTLINDFCDENAEENINQLVSYDKEFYMIELLQYQNDNVEEARDYLKDTFLDFLERTIFPLTFGEVVSFTRQSQWPSHNAPLWDEALIIKFPSSYLFQKNVLESTTMEDKLNERKKYFKTQMVWMATLDPTATSIKGTANTMEDALLLFHGMTFKEPNGRFSVKTFDEQTRSLKYSHDFNIEAWLDVETTCIGGGYADQFDQIRLESIPSIESYAAILADPTWTDAHKYLAEGTTEDSFSAFCEFNQQVDSFRKIFN